MADFNAAGRRPLRAYDWIAHHSANRASKEAVREVATGRRFNYADLDRRADAMATYFRSLGIGAGDRVAVMANNGVEFFDLQFACARTGAICVLINWRLALAELEFIVNDSKPLLLVHDAEFAVAATKLQGFCDLPNLLTIDHRSLVNPYEAVVSRLSGQAVQHAKVTHDDVLTIMYTSGTTGTPKGAMITHGMVLWHCVNMSVAAGVGPDSVHLTALPLFHTGGLNVFSNPILHAGGTVVLMRAFEATEVLRVIGDAAQGITHFFAVPSPYQLMLQHPDFERTDLSRLRVACVGGAPSPLPLIEAWAVRGVHLAQGFGMTETMACIFLEPQDAARKAGSTGKALMHSEMRIARADGGECAPDEIGELWVAGPTITPGYWNRPEATAGAFEGTWFKTGDAARMDATGFVYIVDRWKDMYISGGENVYPAEVENVLYQLPQIAEAAVLGVPNKRWGEVGVAVLVLHQGAELDGETVIAHCLSRLAKFKAPHKVMIVDHLPRNATGKVLKRELRNQLASVKALTLEPAPVEGHGSGT
jgi:fatty-acyl-CoA synthase